MKKINIFSICIILIAVIGASANNTISVNFYKDINGMPYGKVTTNSFGVAVEDSVTDGWMDKLSDVHKGYALTTSDGTISTVVMETIRPNGNGYDTTSATNYNATSMRSYINSYTNSSSDEAQVSLSNLNANFPNGYKIITYLGGASQNTGASISLTEGEPADWDAASDTTYYFKTRYHPDPGSEVVYNGTATTDAPSTIYVGNGYINPAPYYDFYTNANATGSVDINDLVFYKGQTYTFERIAGISNHPFYISDTPDSNGNYYNGILSFSNTGGSTSAGIVSSEKITFTIPSSSYTNEIHYYCVAHSSMVGEKLELGQINSIPGWDKVPVKAIDTTSSVGADTAVADYALFDNLSADQVTLTVDSIQGGTAGIGGIQIIGLEEPSPSGSGKVLSVNIIHTNSLNSTTIPNQSVTGSFGLDAYNSNVGNWHNAVNPTTGTNAYWTFNDGTASTVQMTGFRPEGNAYDIADNSPGAANDGNATSNSDSDNYDGTPLRGFAKVLTADQKEVHITLNNMTNNFPNGYKVIAYLGGQSANIGARVRLSIGGSSHNEASGWQGAGNDLGTYYFKTRWNPDAPGLTAGYHGTLLEATSQDDALLNATSGTSFSVADYAVWENITEDKVTITVDNIAVNNNQQQAGLSAIQIVGEGAVAPQPDPEYVTWLSNNGLTAGSENLDADEDGVANLIEYALGLDPNTDEGNDGITGATVSTNSLTLTHAVRSGLDHGLVYTVETTDDLKFGSWANTGVTVSNIDTSGVLDQLTHTVTSTNDAVFLRLKVEVE